MHTQEINQLNTHQAQDQAHEKNAHTKNEIKCPLNKQTKKQEIN